MILSGQNFLNKVSKSHCDARFMCSAAGSFNNKSTKHHERNRKSNLDFREEIFVSKSSEAGTHVQPRENAILAGKYCPFLVIVV